MIIAGIDYSINSPAITVFDTEKKDLTYWNCDMFSRTPKKTLVSMDSHVHVTKYDGVKKYPTETERYYQNALWAGAVLQQYKVERVMLEGYGFASKTIHLTAENTSLLKMVLWKSGIPFETVQPTEVKKFFTEKGNADKKIMCLEFTERTKVSMSMVLGLKAIDAAPASDLVDSFAIASFFLNQINS